MMDRRNPSMRLIIIHIVCALVLCFCNSTSSQPDFDGAAPPLPDSGVRFFSGLLNLPIPNYGMTSQNAFRQDNYGIGHGATGDVGENDGQNDGLWCQSASSVSNIGTWIQPNGDTVQDVDGRDTNFPVYMVQTQGQVGLLRPNALDASAANNALEGLFQCIIPDENGDSQTLVLWIGANDAFTNIKAASLSQNLSFVPPSQPRDSDPPKYSLTFIVNDIPPTYVTCLKDDSVMDDADISREVIDAHYTGSGDSTSVHVTLTLKTRDAANYNCNVTFYKFRGVSATSANDISPEDTVPAVTTALISISVTGTPTDLIAERTELNEVKLSWTAPASKTPPVAGYEVFYAVSGTNSTQSGANITNITNTTNISAMVSTGLMLESMYNFFVVAFSNEENTLPSAHSNTKTVELNIPEFNGTLNADSTISGIALSWSQLQFKPTGYNLTSVCSLLCNDVTLDHTVPNPSASDTSVNISGLPPGSECNITLTARYGNSINSPLNVIMTTMSDVPQAPPTGLNVSSVGTTFLCVTWNALDCDQQNGPITNYSIRYIANDTTQMINTDTTAHNLTGLDPCTNYSLRVAAVNEAGTGNFSESFSEITLAAKNPGPAELNTTNVTLVTITVSWIPPSNENGIIVAHELNYTLEGNTTTSKGSETIFELTELGPSTSVEFTVRSFSICGAAGPVSSLNVSTMDIPVLNDSFQVIEINSTAVNASWTQDNSEFVQSYIVYYMGTSAFASARRKRQVEEEMMEEFPASTSFGVITGLNSSLNYTFQLAVTYNISGKVFEGVRTPSIESEVPPPPPIPTSSIFSTTIPTSRIDPGSSTAPTSRIDSGSSTAPSVTTPTSAGPASVFSVPVIGAVAGIVILVIVIVLVVVFVIMFLRKRGTKSSKYLTDSQKSVSSTQRKQKPDEVQLLPLPVIEKFPDDTKVENGRRISFKVLVTGVPTPTYQWYHDGKPIEMDYAHEINEDGSLVIVTAEHKHKGTYKLVARNSEGGAAEAEFVLTVVQEGELNRKAPLSSEASKRLLQPIPVTEFGQFVAEGHASSNSIFCSMYAAMDSGESDHPVTFATSKANKPLNRFANITTYDDNRISLAPISGQPACQNDYINASYIDGYSLPHKYIATQGPISKTMVDFWRLVWQERPPTIVMVTNLKERNKNKCEQYWPDSGSREFGPFRVTLSDKQVLSDYIVRSLLVELPSSSTFQFKVTQFHFTSWPDHGVPEYGSSLLGLYRRVKAMHNPKRGPMIVHCSAGVGRTGTFIAIDSVLEKIEQEKVVDIPGAIVRMRHQRMKMVQTDEQFIFICDTILESVTCGNTEIDAGRLRQEINTLKTVNAATKSNGFHKQFDVLEQVSPNPAEVKHDIALEFKDKNRSLEYLPTDKHRVPLKESPDYIHATFVNAYKQKKAFIIAQNPLENTCRDFWKMVMDRGCGVIVMLGTTVENGQNLCAQYWPTAGVANFEEFRVELLGEIDRENHFERRKLQISDKTGKQLTVMHYQILNLDSSGKCSNPQSIISVQEEMYKVQRRTGNNPVVIHCSDTVSRSGIFCAIATIIDRCKTEGVVDVFQVVKSQRIQKPGMVPTVEQYQFLFEAVVAFLDSFEIYSNFNTIM